MKLETFDAMRLHGGPRLTDANVAEWMRLAVEPWRGYFPYRPDDMPRKSGNAATLAKLTQELGG